MSNVKSAPVSKRTPKVTPSRRATNPDLQGRITVLEERLNVAEHAVGTYATRLAQVLHALEEASNAIVRLEMHTFGHIRVSQDNGMDFKDLIVAMNTLRESPDLYKFFGLQAAGVPTDPPQPSAPETAPESAPEPATDL